jgi:hypothetical protein
MCFDLGLCVSTANGRWRERRSSVLGVRVELAQRAVGTHRNASGVVVGCGGRSHLEDDWRKAPKGRVGRLGEREKERSVVGSGVDSSLRRNDVRRGRSQGRQGSRRAGPRSRGRHLAVCFPARQPSLARSSAGGSARDVPGSLRTAPRQRPAVGLRMSGGGNDLLWLLQRARGQVASMEPPSFIVMLAGKRRLQTHLD